MCSLELQEWQLMLPEMENLGAAVVAVSPQTVEATRKTVEDNKVTFPVLCDQGNETARKFGLAFTLPNSFQQMYRNFGIDLAASNGNDSNELPIAATYVIGTDGVIAEAFIDVDHSKRMEPAAAIETVKSWMVNGSNESG